MKMLLLGLTILAAYSCGGSVAEPTGPLEEDVALLKGTYTGTATDNTGSGKMSWTLDDNGVKHITGTMKASTTSGQTVFQGDLTGTVNGSTLDFKIAVPKGGVSGQPNCTISITGVAKGLKPDRIVGTYSGSSSCGSSFSNGSFDLKY